MIANRSHYQLLASIFKYPTGDWYVEDVKLAKEMIRQKYPELFAEFSYFTDYIESHSLYEIEEMFNLTFHIQAICYLDLGYVLFGEDYKRGEFLVNMKLEHERINHDYGIELADNLPAVLELVSLHHDHEFLNEFGVRILIPALEKMSKEFDQARIDLRHKIHKKKERVVLEKDQEIGNIYGAPIKVLHKIIQKDFEDIKFQNDAFEPEYGRNFLANCSTCSSHNEPTPINKK